MADIKNTLNGTADPTFANDASQGYAIGSSWFNRNTGELWKCANATTGSAEWILAAFDDTLWPPGHASFAPGITALADGQPNPNKLIMQKFTFHRKVMIEAIGIHLVTPQAGAAVRLGLYGYNRQTQWVGNRIADGGELLLDPTTYSGETRAFVQGLTVYLNPGIYFGAAVLKTPTGTQATVKRISTGTMGVYTRPKGQDLASPGRYLSGALTYGALPSVPPTMAFDSGTDGVAIMLAKG
ncbi:hypothetical protein [Aureimonas sp. SK2]|uniref:hypothetical protein n=1 Tax=Aureimonas sp. SK2 TaxID=3015992 RepID=UPI002445236F|nr:hypothetical protein [Aureimonas sp. SK2]